MEGSWGKSMDNKGRWTSRKTDETGFHEFMRNENEVSICTNRTFYSFCFLRFCHPFHYDGSEVTDHYSTQENPSISEESE